MIYGDYVRQDGLTVFVYPDKETGMVILQIKEARWELFRQQLSPANADMIALYLQQNAAKLKP